MLVTIPHIFFIFAPVIYPKDELVGQARVLPFRASLRQHIPHLREAATFYNVCVRNIQRITTKFRRCFKSSNDRADDGICSLANREKNLLVEFRLHGICQAASVKL